MKMYLFKPKYWPLLFIFTFSRLLVNILPYKILMIVSISLGWLIKPLVKKRILVTMINLRIAFPQKTEKEIKKLANKCYRSVCMSAFECLIAWFMTANKFKKIKINFVSADEFIKSHNDRDRNVIILGFHFHCLEIAGRYVGESIKKMSVVYQKNKNPLIEETITSSRKKYFYKCFHRKNILSVIKHLKKGLTIWYAPDQDFKEHSVFAPFFSKDCATLTVTPLIANKTNATVFPAYYVRRKNFSGYDVVFCDPIKFSGNIYKDAEMTNKILENFIRKHPEQYLWQHRRYKTRPDGESLIY